MDLSYPDGTLWLAASKGLVHFFPAQGDWQWIKIRRWISNEDVRSLLLDPSGMIWVGTIYGLNLLDPTTDKFVQFIHQAKNAIASAQNLSIPYFSARIKSRGWDVWRRAELV